MGTFHRLTLLDVNGIEVNTIPVYFNKNGIFPLLQIKLYSCPKIMF
jgi:hypothetical protein